MDLVTIAKRFSREPDSLIFISFFSLNINIKIHQMVK